jgi:tetratricopeptide (TPR) repeat protein
MRTFATLIVLVLLSGSARADDDADSSAAAAQPSKTDVLRQKRLDSLLAKLHTTPVNADASRTEAEIWEIWSRNDSPTAEVLLRESSAAISNGDLDVAEVMLSQALETFPTYAEAWNRRASLYYLKGRFDAALIDLDHALDLEPRNFGAWAGKGLVLQALKRYDEATDAYNEALVINPHLDSVRAELAQIDKDRPKI